MSDDLFRGPARLAEVLRVVYLIFTQGHTNRGPGFVRAGMCDTAVRLARSALPAAAGRAAYRAALELEPAPAERAFLHRRIAVIGA